MGKKVVETSKAPKAIGPYSQAVVKDGWVFISGQIPISPETNEIVEGDIQSQTEQVLKNIGAVLNSAGLDFPDVVKTTVYMRNLGDFMKMNETYARFFCSNPPARAAVEVSNLPKGVAVEIEAIARG